MKLGHISALLALLALPGDGAAQGFGGSFDTGAGGSFDGGGATTQPTSPGTGAGSDNFGGSFDGGSFDTGPSNTGPSNTGPTDTGPTNTGPVVGGGDFDGGSFESVQPGSGPGAVTPPTDQTAPPPDQTIRLDPQILAFETRDFGVPPTGQLRNGQMHGATPTAIPGGQIVSTEALANAINSGVQLVLIDVLGGQYSLPNALVAPGLAQPGNTRDRVQQQAAQWLQQVTQGNPDMPIVVYCSDPQCWLSYNAALRTISAGYRQVYWYRGGLQAW